VISIAHHHHHHVTNQAIAISIAQTMKKKLGTIKRKTLMSQKYGSLG
jgi:hypothetical protein